VLVELVPDSDDLNHSHLNDLVYLKSFKYRDVFLAIFEKNSSSCGDTRYYYIKSKVQDCEGNYHFVPHWCHQFPN
jgi:hypothetical protein